MLRRRGVRYTERALDGRSVDLEFDVERTDRFDRAARLCVARRPAVQRAASCSTGIARQATFPPNVRYVDRFTAAQRSARAKGAGSVGVVSRRMRAALPDRTTVQLDVAHDRRLCAPTAQHPAARAIVPLPRPTRPSHRRSRRRCRRGTRADARTSLDPAPWPDRTDEVGQGPLADATPACRGRTDRPGSEVIFRIAASRRSTPSRTADPAPAGTCRSCGGAPARPPCGPSGAIDARVGRHHDVGVGDDRADVVLVHRMADARRVRILDQSSRKHASTGSTPRSVGDRSRRSGRSTTDRRSLSITMRSQPTPLTDDWKASPSPSFDGGRPVAPASRGPAAGRAARRPAPTRAAATTAPRPTPRTGTGRPSRRPRRGRRSSSSPARPHTTRSRTSDGSRAPEPGAAPDLDRLVHRAEQVFALAADVRCVDAAVRATASSASATISSVPPYMPGT